jgi:flagellar hook-basal body complex protein FliE
MTIAPLSVTASAAAQAYRSVDSGSAIGGADVAGTDFSSVMQRAIGGAVATGENAESQSLQAIKGHGDLTQVVTAVSNAELALQTTATLRDRMVSAYQDIMKMPI